MYPNTAVDGDDLVLLSRTSRDSRDQHDAHLCTIHRVYDFRGQRWTCTPAACSGRLADDERPASSTRR